MKSEFVKYNYALRYEDVRQEIARDMTEDLENMFPDYSVQALDEDRIEFDNHMATWVILIDRELGDEYEAHIAIVGDEYRFYEIFAYPAEEDGDHGYVDSQKRFIDYAKARGVDING